MRHAEAQSFMPLLEVEETHGLIVCELTASKTGGREDGSGTFRTDRGSPGTLAVMILNLISTRASLYGAARLLRPGTQELEVLSYSPHLTPFMLNLEAAERLFTRASDVFWSLLLFI